MELLFTVHWVATREPEPATDRDAAASAVAAWSPRKATLFTPAHVHAAWDHLAERGWAEDLIPAEHPVRGIRVVVDAVLAELDPVFACGPPAALLGGLKRQLMAGSLTEKKGKSSLAVLVRLRSAR